VTSKDKVPESPSKGRSTDSSTGPGGVTDRASLPRGDSASGSNDLERGTSLDHHGVPLGSGGGGGGNMGVDTSVAGKLNRGSEEEKAKFGEIRIPRAKP